VDKVKRIFSGGNFAILIHADDTITSFGFGNDGELGRPGANKILIPTKDDAAAFILPYQNNSDGSLNVPALRQVMNPTEVVLPRGFRGKRVVTVACGYWHVLFLLEHVKTSKTEVYVMGCDGSGQLGLDRGFCNYDMPTLLDYFKNIDVADIAAGKDHSLVLDKEGRLYSFGDGSCGQLGLDGVGGMGRTNVTIPRQVQALAATKITTIAAGECFSMAICEDGKLWTFGVGGTGHKIETRREDPVFYPRVLEISNAVEDGDIVRIHAMDGGSKHGCLLVDVLPTPRPSDSAYTGIPASAAQG
jgi:alpha-tubulin suppressor-like RCC1 family protein